MDEKVRQKFRAAWSVFAQTCSDSVMPEATYQVWFAHYLISQFGTDRVAREPNFDHNFFPKSDDKQLQTLRSKIKSAEFRPDVVVLDEPGVLIPHWVWRDKEAANPNATGGLDLVRHLVAMSELKVGSTTGGGFRPSTIEYDIVKLEVLLAEARRLGIAPEQMPCAFMCVLDNHPTHIKCDVAQITSLVERELGFDSTVELLIYPQASGAGT